MRARTRAWLLKYGHRIVHYIIIKSNIYADRTCCETSGKYWCPSSRLAFWFVYCTKLLLTLHF